MCAWAGFDGCQDAIPRAMGRLGVGEVARPFFISQTSRNSRTCCLDRRISQGKPEPGAQGGPGSTGGTFGNAT